MANERLMIVTTSIVYLSHSFFLFSNSFLILLAVFVVIEVSSSTTNTLTPPIFFSIHRQNMRVLPSLALQLSSVHKQLISFHACHFPFSFNAYSSFSSQQSNCPTHGCCQSYQHGFQIPLNHQQKIQSHYLPSNEEFSIVNWRGFYVSNLVEESFYYYLNKLVDICQKPPYRTGDSQHFEGYLHFHFPQCNYREPSELILTLFTIKLSSSTLTTVLPSFRLRQEPLPLKNSSSKTSFKKIDPGDT